MLDTLFISLDNVLFPKSSTLLMENVLHLVPSPAGPWVVSPLTSSISHTPDFFLSLILPTFNESKNIEPLLQRLGPVLEGEFRENFEVILVDDDSPDKTWEIALVLTSRFPWLRVMRRQLEKGLASAVIRGWQAARGNILGVMDADLQHPPEVLSELSKKIRTAELTLASRNVEGGGVSEWDAGRRSISKIAHGIGALILPDVFKNVSDPLSGFFLVRREVVENISFDPTGYKILIEVLARTKPQRVSEAGYIFEERKTGKSKINARICGEYLYHLMKLCLKR